MAIREMQSSFGYWDKRDCINMLKHNADIDEHDDWHEIRAILTDEGQIVFYDKEGKLRIIGGLYDEQKEKKLPQGERPFIQQLRRFDRF